ncbi:MAG: hypothetical protein HC896_03620 [Bacteroidales bacterium]|nr:hypothetical protein [Bacteroidales bacterium]
MDAEYFGEPYMKNGPIANDIADTVYFEHKVISHHLPDTHYAVRYTGHVIPDETTDFRFFVSGNYAHKLFIDGNLVIDNWLAGRDGEDFAVARLQKNKKHKVVLEYYRVYGRTPIIRFGYMKDNAYLAEKQSVYDKALRLAENADMVVLCAGFTSYFETEGTDRTFEMPLEQDKLINDVSTVNKNLVVTITAGGNVAMDSWVDNVPALVHTWYPGQEGGRVLAEILAGDINPSGKIPASFERKWEDNACYNSYYDNDGDMAVQYSEGIFLGYRHFDKPGAPKPLFPFGHGLSYTTFTYSNMHVSSKGNFNDRVKVSCTISNSGKVNGAEVVQLYVRDEESSLPRPEKELKGFDKVFLKAGEEKVVEFLLDQSAFSFYDPKAENWVAEPGKFNILIGSSSADIKLEHTLDMIK